MLVEEGARVMAKFWSPLEILKNINETADLAKGLRAVQGQPTRNRLPKTQTELKELVDMGEEWLKMEAMSKFAKSYIFTLV